MAVEEEQIALLVEQLHVAYGHVLALKDVSFAIPKGKMVGILGPNGAGKSTLIRSLLGLTPAFLGKVNFMEKSKKVAYVPQRSSVDLDFPITVQEVVSMGCYGRRGLFRRIDAQEKQKIAIAMEQTGLTSLAKRPIGELSGGQQQKTFLARALVQDADIYLLDEPFTGVDMTTENAMVQILQGLCKLGKTLCIVHHDLHRVQQYFDYILLLNVSLIACGPTQEVFHRENLRKAYGESGFFTEFS
ncbi:MAG: metal ABC transporter ATP-binding protein [Chlamydiae bacterium]|nr:metal ABC transporter ATP-binding protein [Chlamydiota bacterium]